MDELREILGLVRSAGPFTALMLWMIYRDFRDSNRRKKFLWSSGLLEKTENNIMNELEDLKAEFRRSPCAFSIQFQDHLNCIHSIAANEALNRKELLTAIDENILQISQLLDRTKAG